jgi:hypothetical protein
MRPGGPGGWDKNTKTDRDKAYDFQLPDDESQWSQILKPLYAHRKKMIALEGLSYASALADKDTNNHNAGTAHALTGARMKFPGGFKNEGGGGGSSIDQLIADEIKDDQRIKSLYYTTGGWSPAFLGESELRGVGSISDAYDKLFPVSNTPDATTNWLKKRRKSVMGLVKQEYEKVVPRLSGEDKAKLKTHFDLVSELEKSITFKTDAVCGYQREQFSSNPGNPASSAGNLAMQGYPAVPRPLVEDWGKLFTAAFSCDMTRVGLFVNAGFGGSAPTDHLDVHTDIHLDVAHNAVFGKDAGGAYPEGEGFTKMTRYYATLAAEFASIVSSFDQIQEDGKSLLDQTTCVWLCEMANGPHNLHDVMAVVVGGGGFNGFKLGRYVKFKEDMKAPKNTGGAPIGPGHNQLLVSLLNAYGISGNQVGMEKASDEVSLTGPLPKLKG